MIKPIMKLTYEVLNLFERTRILDYTVHSHTLSLHVLDFRKHKY